MCCALNQILECVNIYIPANIHYVADNIITHILQMSKSRLWPPPQGL